MDANNNMIDYNHSKRSFLSVKSFFAYAFALFYIMSAQTLHAAVPVDTDSSTLDPLKDMSVLEWLAVMSQEQKNSQYHGIFTYEYGAELASVEVWHGTKDGYEIERMVHLDGEPREVIRDHKSMLCNHAGKELIKVQNAAARMPVAKIDPLNIEKIRSTYDARYVGRYRVAGHNAVVVELTPKDVYRYGQRYFIGSDNKMLLKNILFDSKRRALERFQFTYLNAKANLSDADFEPQLDMTSGSERGSEDQKNVVHKQLSFSWRLDWVPEGFDLVESPGNNSAKTEQMYSDGLASFSVFIDEGEASGSRSASSLMRGATLVYSRPIVLQVAKLQGKAVNVTIVGEIPLAAAERIAASIEFMP